MIDEEHCKYSTQTGRRWNTYVEHLKNLAPVTLVSLEFLNQPPALGLSPVGIDSMLQPHHSDVMIHIKSPMQAYTDKTTADRPDTLGYLDH